MLEAPPIAVEETTLSQPSVGLSALLSAAAWAPLSSMGLVRVTGEDRVRWLNGMVTNSIQSLQPGEGCYNFFLSAQGRIQGDATAWVLDDSILLETARERIPALIELLERFIIMDDVELHELSASAAMEVAGPGAAGLLAKLGLPALEGEDLHLSHINFEGQPVDLIHAYSPLVPRYELWADSETLRKLQTALEAIAPQASPADVEDLRLLEGSPRYGIDIRDRELPQETAQTRALHFAKGCYLGQEIVERIRSRGNVHRTFSGFTLTGPVPPAGAALFSTDAPEKAVGELTSAQRIVLPAGPITLALGYIRREALDRGQPLTYEGGTASPAALPLSTLKTEP
jgi:aminomethyltransferase